MFFDFTFGFGIATTTTCTDIQPRNGQTPNNQRIDNRFTHKLSNYDLTTVCVCF